MSYNTHLNDLIFAFIENFRDKKKMFCTFEQQIESNSDECS